MFSKADYERVATMANSRLRFRYDADEIPRIFKELGLGAPGSEEIAAANQYIAADRKKIIQSICDHIAVVCPTRPTLRELQKIVQSLHGNTTRRVLTRITALASERMADQWAKNESYVPNFKVRMNTTEVALIHALAKSYGISKRSVPKMLLRIFTVAAVSGKISLMDVHRLSDAVTDADLELFLKSLTFTLKK